MAANDLRPATVPPGDLLRDDGILIDGGIGLFGPQVVMPLWNLQDDDSPIVFAVLVDDRNGAQV